MFQPNPANRTPAFVVRWGAAATAKLRYAPILAFFLALAAAQSASSWREQVLYRFNGEPGGA